MVYIPSDRWQEVFGQSRAVTAQNRDSAQRIRERSNRHIDNSQATLHTVRAQLRSSLIGIFVDDITSIPEHMRTLIAYPAAKREAIASCRAAYRTADINEYYVNQHVGFSTTPSF